MLRRHAACLESLRRFEATAEAEDECGRRRLWVEYRRGGAASEGRGRHHVVGGYQEVGGGDGGEPSKWRSTSLQGCPREVRLLLAGLYYYDVDMVNSLPNVARQLARRGMVSESNLRALRVLCSERDEVLEGIVEYYGVVDSPALGKTARDVAKDLPIRLLHGGGHGAWLAAHGLQDGRPAFPLMAKLEEELRGCRREVYLYMRQHDAAWLARVEAHVRKEKVKEAPSRRGQAAAAACEAWLQERVEASVFARVLQDIEDRCLDCVRRVLQDEGWLARSWQQDGLLVGDHRPPPQTLTDSDSAAAESCCCCSSSSCCCTAPGPAAAAPGPAALGPAAAAAAPAANRHRHRHRRHRRRHRHRHRHVFDDGDRPLGRGLPGDGPPGRGLPPSTPTPRRGPPRPPSPYLVRVRVRVRVRVSGPRPQRKLAPTTTGFHDARQVAQLDHPVCLGGGPRRENLLVRLVGTWR